MSLAAKVVIAIVVTFVLVGIGVVGLGAYLWTHHGSGLLDAASKQYDQGQAFGQQTDEAGCLDQALVRVKANSGATGSMAASVFARACWNASRPTPGFCDGVPKPLEVLRAVRWQAEQTRKAGVDDQFGGQIFAAQRRYCETRTR